MPKIDYKKEYKEFYNCSVNKSTEVNVSQMNFLMIDGIGDPNTSNEFKQAVEALYSLSYSIKFYIKKNNKIDYAVMPLEGLWWADNMNDFNPVKGNKNNWKWTLMIMHPDFINDEIVKINKEICYEKKKNNLINKIRFEKFAEGSSVQIMHIGPYSNEEDNILKLHQNINDMGAHKSGKHHEIYLSDSRKCSPEKMKTILRQPFRK